MSISALLLAVALPASAGVEDTEALMAQYVRGFNSLDIEYYTNAIPNSAAEEFMRENCPRLACPDKDIERTYYFRWWTFRKHLRNDLGVWTVSEFLPKVSWSKAGNTIVCPAGHHLREGRWLRDPKYMEDYARFWLHDKRANHRWGYSSWLYSATCLLAETTGLDALPGELLDDAVAYYRRWEQGFDRGSNIWMGGDGKGGFTSHDGYEGTEISLGQHGYKPLFASAMYAEARAIAEVAKKLGRSELALEFEAKAETNRQSIIAHCWNEDVKFFTTAKTNGVKGVVRELHGFAPWYFEVPTGELKPDFGQLTDPFGFYGEFGLSCAERRAKGWVIDYSGHECKWNGPSWAFATSIALTAYLNYLHASPLPSPSTSTSTSPSPSTSTSTSTSTLNSFLPLLTQYAAQHQRRRDMKTEGDDAVVPWIDENCHPDKMEWIARKIILATPSMKARFPKERGKDYNHSTFCDLVISGLIGFIPNGVDGFTLMPLIPHDWSYCVLENLRYRGHDITISWNREQARFAICIDGKEVKKTSAPCNTQIRIE